MTGKDRLPGPSVSPAIGRVVDFLGELGSRWGLPADACRVHAYLYLVSRPASEDDIGQALGLEVAALTDALAWLTDYRLIEPAASGWQTGNDPWQLMLRALEERRRREIVPALDLLRDCRRITRQDGDHDRAAEVQIGKLIDMVEDLAAIDAQARRLSPQTLRQLVGIGGRAARFIDRAVGGGAGK